MSTKKAEEERLLQSGDCSDCWYHEEHQSPLCHFYFSHPFRVGDVYHGTLPLPIIRPNRSNLLTVSRARRGGRGRASRPRGRRRHAPRTDDIKTQLLLRAAHPGSGPSLEEVLWTIRDAWPPPRSLSVDSESMCSPNCSMGTGQNLKGGVNNRLSLPHRRYSVPETVMRKYSLTRQRSAESTESGNATVPTPSVPSAGTDTRSAQMNDSTRRKTHTVNKACQTSPRSSLISSMSFSSSYKSAIRKQWDHKKKANSLDEASSKDTTDDSQLYFDANYKDSIEKYKTEILREISLPGEVILQKEETTKSIIITKSDEQKCEDNEEKENMNDETQEIRDVDNYVIEEDIKILLENITKDRTIKLLLGFRAKSFPERSEIHSVEDSKSKREIKSANGRLFSKEFKTKDNENALIENDSTLSNVKDLTQFDDTPSPQVQESPPQENSLSPPKSGHSSDQSAECYITDCDICTAEGRKCCSLDNSSEVFSFTSPDMVMTTNELKTSSEFTSTSVTLDQTVSDHSTSTQDSTLSITSITPESYNSNSTDSKNMLNNQDRITPSAIGLVINSETTILDPIQSKESTKNLNYNLSDSEGSENNKHSKPIPLVLTSETIVMEPIQCDTSKTHCVLEMMETDSTITEGSERTQQQLETTDDNENKIEINEGETDEKMYDSLEINKEVSLTESAMNSDDQKRIINPNKLKVLNIFLNRKIDFRQSTGSAIIEDNNGFQNESIIRSMSCGELQNEIDLQNNNNVELSGKDYENNLDDEGDLLEQLGFKEEPKSGLGSGRTSSSFLELCGRRLSYDEMCKKQMQDMFYGNKTYEVITNVNNNNNINNNNNNSTSDITRRNVMGNVMSTSDESLKSYYNNKKPPQRHEAEINSSHVSFSSVTNINNLNEDDGRLSGYTISQQEMNCDGKCNEESDETICGNVIMLRIPMPTDEDGKPIPTCLEGPVIESTGKELIIPRYSAMPRTVSMLVNTSSADYSSDSELSLADSLEDITSSEPPNSNETQTWTNKHDNRLVRGDVISLLPENNKKLKRQKTNEAYAYFVSLSGEMGEIKTETIPENLKQKLMKRDNEIRRHIDHHHFHHHHHPRRKDRRFESLFKKTLKKKAPQLSQSDFYDSSSKEEVGKLRKAYSLTSADSEERLVKQDSKFTQWEENPEPQKKILQEVDEEKVIKEQKESKWLKCNKLIKSDPELDKVVSDVILASLLIDQQQLDLDEEIKDILLEALKEDEEHAKDSNKSPEGNEEQVVPIKKNGDETKSNVLPTHKSISIQTAESSLHVNACESFEYCELCHQNNIKEDKLYENGSKSDDFLKNDSLNLQAQKDPMEKIDNLITNNLKSVCRDKLGGTTSAAKSQQQTLDISIPVPNRKIINQSKGEKTMTKHKPPHGVSDKSKVSRSPRSHSCINLNNNTNKQPIRPHPVKVPQSRRSANTLGVRFQQKFEAIPEEKSGSMESSEEQKSPKPSSSRRLSIPSDILLLSKDSKKNIQKNRESNINKDLLEPTTSNVSHDQGRRHTIHGNIQDGEPYRDKTDQSRRHTVHGNINVNAGQISGIRRINLNVGTIMRGQVIGQRGNVMIGRFRPLNDETQVEKDENEKILIGEIERIRRKMCKGKEALETSKSEEQEELLTLSKGWINFYLLRESGEFSSDHSINDDDSSNSPTSNETIGRVVPPLQTVNSVDKPEDKVHQYTVQIRATEETVASYSPSEHESKLPDLNKSRKRSPRSSSESPDVTLPDIPAPSPVTSPTSTKSRTPTFSEITSQQNEVLPQLHSGKRSILSNSKTKSSAKKYITTIQEQKESSSPTSDQGYNYLHLPSPHSEVQSRSPNTPCQEISPITPSSSTCDSRSESPVLPSIKWPMRQIQRRHIHRYQRTDIGRQQPPLPIHPVAQSSGTCWTVTVAGNSGNPQQPPPDVEMRLSFQSNQQQTSPNQQQHHHHQQQEPYTTVHNSNNISSSQIIQETKERRLRRSIQDPIPTPTPPQPCWSLTVKNKNQGEEREGRKSHHEKSSKRSAKKGYQYKGEERSEEEERQFSFIWPKVEEILDHGPIRKPSMNSVQWNSSDIQELSVTGLAITPEKKPRVPTMSERDLTRVHYSRTKLF